MSLVFRIQVFEKQWLRCLTNKSEFRVLHYVQWILSSWEMCHNMRTMKPPHSLHMIVICILPLVLASCLPGIERPLDLNTYYDVSVDGRVLHRGDRGFTYSNREYDLNIDLGDGTINTFGVLTGPPFVQLSLTNRSSEPILLHWNESSFVLQTGDKARLIDFDANLTYFDRPFEPAEIAVQRSQTILATTPGAFGSNPEFVFVPGLPIPVYAGQSPRRAHPIINTDIVRQFGMNLAIEASGEIAELSLRMQCNVPPPESEPTRTNKCPTVRD